MTRLRKLLPHLGSRLSDAVRRARGIDADGPAAGMSFRYGKEIVAFLWVIVIVTAVETVIVELAVPWVWLRILLAVVCIGSLPLMAGMVAAQRIRPHVLSDHEILLRCADQLQAVVPLSRIAAVATIVAAAPRAAQQDGSTLFLTPTGTANVAITLSPTASDATGLPEPTDEITRILVAADEPDAMVAAIRERRAGHDRRVDGDHSLRR